MQVRASQAAYLPAGGTLRFKPGLMFSGLLIVMLTSLLYWAVQKITAPVNVPISKIQVQGAFIHMTESMLAPLSREISGVGYFDLDVAALQRQIEALPWVEHATVRRVWPDTVAIHFVEQQPLAVWADGGIVNREGEVFEPERTTYPDRLPVFSGPENLQKTMVDSYQQFSELLLPLGITISEMELDKRHSWRIGLRNGISLRLGNEHIMERLVRFTRVYPKIKSVDSRAIKSIDLRYTNGLAIAWRNEE